MKFACYIKKLSLRGDERVVSFMSDLKAAGHDVYIAGGLEEIEQGTDALLSLGGDGTFLAASQFAIAAGIPVMGVNFGRLGFLSENSPELVVQSLAAGDYVVEDRKILEVSVEGSNSVPFHALNEVCISRMGPAMLGVEVSLDNQKLPVYWADGLIVATSSGSTAYSLSVGGPICLPDSKVMIVAPVSPHNLNLRPLVVPQETVVNVTFRSRSGQAVLSMDNRNLVLPQGASFTVRTADVNLKRMRLKESNFINALRGRLLWGEDVRNS